MAAKINWRQNDVTVALCIAGDVCPASPVASTPMRPEPTHQRIVAADRTRVEVRPGGRQPGQRTFRERSAACDPRVECDLRLRDYQQARIQGGAGVRAPPQSQ